VLLWKFLFKLGLWVRFGREAPRTGAGGALPARGQSSREIGLPVIVAMDAPFFRVPIYTLAPRW
jgi:hypothetical protein